MSIELCTRIRSAAATHVHDFTRVDRRAADVDRGTDRRGCARVRRSDDQQLLRLHAREHGRGAGRRAAATGAAVAR